MNDIIELSGCELDEIYENLHIKELKIKDITISVELLEITKEFDNSFDILNSSVPFKFIKLIQQKINKWTH